MKTLCFIGTCQAMALCSIYNNYIRSDEEPLAYYISSNEIISKDQNSLLSKVDYIINQVFSSEQDGVIDQNLHKSKIINFPYVSGLFLWPFATEAHINREYIKSVDFSPYDEEMGDAFLNRLIKNGSNEDECLRHYLELDIVKIGKVIRRSELIFDQQYKRDKITGINAGDFIQNNLSENELFLTRGHLAKPTLLFLAKNVFSHIGIDDKEMERIERQMFRIPDHRNYAAIHPKIGEVFNLKYTKTDRLYEQFYGFYSFDECVKRYVRYDWNQTSVEGLRYENNKQFDNAIHSFSSAIKNGNASAYILHSLGKSLDALGKHSEATPILESALEKTPYDPLLIISLGENYRRVNRLPEAQVLLYEKSIVIPGIPSILEAYSHLLSESGDIIGAYNIIKIAVSESSLNSRYLRHLGSLCVTLGKNDEAVVAFKKLISINQSDKDTYALLGKALLKIGLVKKAEDATVLSLNIDENHIESLFVLGEILKHELRFLEAIQVYKKIYDLKPENLHLLEDLSHLYTKVGDQEKAIAYALKSLGKKPNNIVMLRHLASLYDLNGMNSLLIKICNDTIYNFPDYEEFYQRLICAYINIDQIESAVSIAILGKNLFKNNVFILDKLNYLMNRRSAET